MPGAPFVEVGSYCGRSTIWLGAAARAAGTVVFAVDHHRGSEENQPGWEWHDPTRRRRAHRRDGHAAVRSAAPSTTPGSRTTSSPSSAARPIVARYWSTPAALVFIDGGHGVEPARADYAGWAPHVAVGGTLAIHDVFPDPADGGRPPYEEIFVPALESGRFRLASATGSLASDPRRLTISSVGARSDVGAVDGPDAQNSVISRAAGAG